MFVCVSLLVYMPPMWVAMEVRRECPVTWSWSYSDCELLHVDVRN